MTMTATLTATSRRDTLTARLAELHAERAQALTEIVPSGEGDVADRATNVDGHVRLAMLDERIATVESELAASRRPVERSDTGRVALGDVVTLDFGDGPETFLFGSVEAAGEGADVITPNSPLGRPLQNASVGSTVTYATGPGRKLSVQVIAVS
jgi:transcription elongation factor GreA